MRETRNRPSWWLLYLLGLAMVGLLVLGARAPLSERGHEAAAIGTLLLAGGLVELWLRANTAALMRPGRLIPVQPPRPRLVRQASEEESQPVLVSFEALDHQAPAWRPREEECRPDLISVRRPRETGGEPQAEGTETPWERSDRAC